VIDLSQEEAARVLTDGRVGHVACRSRGELYVTPMSYVMIDGVFYFRTGEGRRIEALRQDPEVCVEVTILREGNAWDSVVFWGTARFVDDVEQRSEIVQAILHKYHEESAFASSTPSHIAQMPPIVAIEPERITGRSSGGGLSGKTRPGRL
jgi:nitroimidazol reductase NimA-like FMN-containing flavoprotein (pyridoxamine 5'-phosphate oxidase superfamily)